jgi:SAM-dependent methyltransferase
VSDVDGQDTLAHYGRLAADYDRNWAYSDRYVDWMTGAIVTVASITATDRIADVGCGTGLYARSLLGLVRPREPILCVDPSGPMLAQIPDRPGLTRLQATAGHFASATAGDGSPGPLDVIVIKEAVHHIPAAERAATLAGLARLLTPGGRILVVMLPATVGYPLFPAALRRFEELQPDPAGIADLLRSAGVAARLTYQGFGLELPKERYLSMVRERYMSMLSMFSDEEIEAGIAEIDRDHPEPVLRFTDRFAFVLGVNAATPEGGRP